MLRAWSADTEFVDAEWVAFDFGVDVVFAAGFATAAALTCVFVALATGWSFTVGSAGSADGSIDGRAVASGVTAGADSATVSIAASLLETMATACELGWLLDAALMTATLATDPAMSTPPAATTVAMMLERCMMFSSGPSSRSAFWWQR
jgi:hypothetical protein